MAENTFEIDTINHLLEVEKNASALISDAALEVDRRLSEAHSKFNSEFKEHYEKEVSKLEAEYNSNHNQIQEKYQKEIDSYKDFLAAKPQNKEAFSSLLDRLIF